MILCYRQIEEDEVSVNFESVAAAGQRCIDKVSLYRQQMPKRALTEAPAIGVHGLAAMLV